MVWGSFLTHRPSIWDFLFKEFCHKCEKSCMFWLRFLSHMDLNGYSWEPAESSCPVRSYIRWKKKKKENLAVDTARPRFSLVSCLRLVLDPGLGNRFHMPVTGSCAYFKYTSYKMCGFVSPVLALAYLYTQVQGHLIWSHYRASVSFGKCSGCKYYLSSGQETFCFPCAQCSLKNWFL